MNKLIEWKNSKYRKPLILKGARQTGKTWLLKEFGKSFPGGIAYISLDRSPEFKEFFISSKSPERILSNLSFALKIKITPHTLLVIDEIQECPEALNSLKYFYEEMPQQPVACAGSLLGIGLSKGFPVGKTNFLELCPMTFTEFLYACGDENLADYMSGVKAIEPVPQAFFAPLTEKLKMYFITGGMPEAVLHWAENRDITLTEQTLQNISMAYESDFAKHPETHAAAKIGLIWHSLPSQLARENKKFMFSLVKDGARAREYEDALQWLLLAGIAKKTNRASRPGLPVSAYEDMSAFKIYLSDTGLLRSISRLAPQAITEGSRLFTEFKGALTENYVMQSLNAAFNAKPSYWADGRHEVDFLLQYENDIIPIEAKSAENIKAASLKNFMEKYPNTPLAVRLSLRNLSLDGKILNIPLFMADNAKRLIKIALLPSAAAARLP